MVCPKTVDTQKRGNLNARPLDLRVAYSWIGASFSKLGGELSGGIPVSPWNSETSNQLCSCSGGQGDQWDQWLGCGPSTSNYPTMRTSWKMSITIRFCCENFSPCFSEKFNLWIHGGTATRLGSALVFHHLSWLDHPGGCGWFSSQNPPLGKFYKENSNNSI